MRLNKPSTYQDSLSPAAAGQAPCQPALEAQLSRLIDANQSLNDALSRIHSFCERMGAPSEPALGKDPVDKVQDQNATLDRLSASVDYAAVLASSAHSLASRLERVA